MVCASSAMTTSGPGRIRYLEKDEEEEEEEEEEEDSSDKTGKRGFNKIRRRGKI